MEKPSLLSRITLSSFELLMVMNMLFFNHIIFVDKIEVETNELVQSNING